MRRGNILPYESIQQLFPNLQELLDVHSKFLDVEHFETDYLLLFHGGC